MSAPPDEPAATSGLFIRLVLHEGAMLGPGKAALLQHIRDTGSIAAAGRRMDMSYKRAWSLVVELNRIFADPLVEPSRGGTQGGGARLTGAGERVLGHFRALESALAQAGAAHIADLRAMVRPGSPPAL